MTDFFIQVTSVLVLMVLYNFISHKVLHDKHHLAFPISATIAVIVVALFPFNLTLEDLGFTNLIQGLLFGGVIAVILGLVIAIGSRLKYTKPFFVDSRVLDVPYRRFFKKTLIDIPFITVIFEEVLFRGLILGYLLKHSGQTEAIVVSSILFGLWHILPSLNFAKTNEKANGLPLATITGTVVFTAITGVFFAWLRVESGSIVAPIMIHYVANSGGYTASWLLYRNGNNQS